MVFGSPENAGGRGTVRVSGSLVVSASLDLLGKIAQGGSPPRHVMLLGYAGWGLDSSTRKPRWLVDCGDIDDGIVWRPSKTGGDWR